MPERRLRTALGTSCARGVRAEQTIMPKLAVVHNSYMSDFLSGEDVVAGQECRLLQAHGLAVYRYSGPATS